MSRLLAKVGDWEVWYRTMCSEYSCGKSGPFVDIERGPHRHAHWHVQRIFRHDLTVSQLLVKAFEYIAATTEAEARERETLMVAEEEARALADMYGLPFVAVVGENREP